MRLSLTTVLILAAAPCLAAPPEGAKPTPLAVKNPTRTAPVSYAKDVSEFLAERCVGCHSDVLAEGKLNLDGVAAMLKGGKHGPALAPGKADESLLFRLAAHRAEPVMPPKDKKDQKPLTPEELGLLKLWIDTGAKDDSAENTEPAKPVTLGELPPGLHPAVAVDLTADGSRIACGRANVVQVYDVNSGLEIVSLGGHRDIVQSVRFSPDGRTLAAGGFQTVTLWDAPTGGLKSTLTGHTDQVRAAGLLNSSNLLATAGLDKKVRFWYDDGRLRAERTIPAGIHALDLSVDGAFILLGCADNIARLYDISKGLDFNLIAEFRGHTGPVNAVALRMDCRTAITGSSDGTVRVWTFPARPGEKPPEPKVFFSGRDKKEIRALADFGDDLVAAAGDAGRVEVWDFVNGTLKRTIPAHDGPVLALAPDPASDLVLAGLADGSAKLIDVNNGKTLAVYRGHRGGVTSVAFAFPEGGKAWSQVVTGGADGGVKVWEKDSGRGVIAFGHSQAGTTPPQPVNRLLLLRAGQLVSVSSDKTVKTWSYEGTWKERPSLGPHAGRVLALDFSPDGALLAAGGGEPSRSGEVKVWDVRKGTLVRGLDALHSDTVFGLRFSPDGSKLATASADRFMKQTRVTDGKEVRAFEGHTQHVMGVDWKSDGKQLATAGADSVLKVWDADSGDQLKTLQGAAKQLTSVRWVPGKAEVVASSGDSQVRVWNPDSGGVVRTLGGAGDYVFGVATSRDGSRIAAGVADGSLFVWNGASGQLLRKFEPPPAAAAARR